MQASSLNNGMIGLDWALIRASSPLPQILNQVPIKMNANKIKKIADEGPVARNIVAITGTNGLLNGLMSPSPIFMMIPYSEHFQELWRVRLAGDVCKSTEFLLPQSSGSDNIQAKGTPDHGSSTLKTAISTVTWCMAIQDMELHISCLRNKFPKTLRNASGAQYRWHLLRLRLLDIPSRWIHSNRKLYRGIQLLSLEYV